MPCSLALLLHIAAWLILKWARKMWQNAWEMSLGWAGWAATGWSHVGAGSSWYEDSLSNQKIFPGLPLFSLFSLSLKILVTHELQQTILCLKEWRANRAGWEGGEKPCKAAGGTCAAFPGAERCWRRGRWLGGTLARRKESCWTKTCRKSVIWAFWKPLPRPSCCEPSLHNRRRNSVQSGAWRARRAVQMQGCRGGSQLI